MLPPDLRTAEAEASDALQQALSSSSAGRWTVELRFEGLRLLPVALRLFASLLPLAPSGRLLLPDAGAAALARRDGPELAASIASFGDQIRLQGEQGSDGLLLLVAPSQAEYEQVEQLCSAHRGPVVLLNPVLEDAAIGIGSVARQRRRGFLAEWRAAYALIPLESSALRRAFPHPWQLYRLDADGFRVVASFEQKPDAEQQAQALSGGAEPGLGENLRSLGQLIEGLQR
ncbi:MAG: DUF1995 family protein [Cyanobium sp.]